VETAKKCEIEICHGPRCREFGGPELLAELAERGIDAEEGFCQSLCPNSPIVRVDDRVVHNAKIEAILEAV